MIHGASKDPVVVKKIALRLWSLKDEIDYVLQSETDLTPEKIEIIRNEYINNPQANSSGLTLVPPAAEAGALAADDSVATEDDMAKAMAGDAPEEKAEETSGENSTPPLVAVNQNDDGKISITQRRPKLEEGRIAHAKTILSEIGMEGIFCFSSHSYLVGQSIVVEFLIPNKIILNAEVLYCKNFNLKSRIISDKKLTYRIKARFTFLKPGERTLLRQFIKSIEPTVQKVEQVKESSGSGDEFSELDDL